MERAYPLVHQHLTRTCIRRFSYVFEWKGQRPELAPLILMGHYDVVPVEAAVAAQWTRAPFSGDVTDSCIWGRGAFGHDEEIRGPSASWVVDYLMQQHIHPEMLLDEGGEISESKTKELGRPLAVIGIAEKGHVSLYRLKHSPPPARLTAPVKEFIDRIGSSSDNLGHRLAASNLWLFEGLVKRILSDQPEGYALTHTTIVPTILEAGVKDNVIPSKARTIVNCRLLPGESIESTVRFIRETLHDPRVVVREIGQLPSEPSAVTDTASPAFRRLVSAVSKTVPSVLPAPYL